jgi:ATP-dependent Zn protease
VLVHHEADLFKQAKENLCNHFIDEIDVGRARGKAICLVVMMKEKIL